MTEGFEAIQGQSLDALLDISGGPVAKGEKGSIGRVIMGCIERL